MLRGIYAAAKGMIAQRKYIDVLGNNVANESTPGFKKDGAAFKTFNEQLITNLGINNNLGSISFGTYIDEVITDVSMGTFEQTNSATDMAITTDGFFAVSDNAGNIGYTRNGSFTIDKQGYLSLSTGHRLIGKNGAILVNGDKFDVTTDGTILRDGKVLDVIQLFKAPAQQNIIKQSDGFFAITGATATAGNIKQGYIEDSNVDTINEMTQLMAATRSFQACQQSFKTIDETSRQTNQIASMK